MQITGGSNPPRRQTDAMRPCSVGLAMCLKFHVARYWTPLAAATAMWSASRGCEAGTAA